ncbi:S1 RNA-binding domain-containing protein [Candidatus Woesearchaeota archaeon]|jgi:translation initiation factor 2 subunit 1|nr:S1 RNA-binding domain-containing protein [Candidatus Woesearchaeota archaeon]MBT5396694.1 S1 RNA-binding domain-containing protein [Candidatus Woesearchaeota archaeon]MBT5924310.1 S1 RNA-binding domain-containing protein [Candidatus Woesearchaeota archaeon]MBT6367519.1 S1 RNA-binding domain-containing protein [Candidatus Woesearchaeota archaeon]MBT7763018.1 S1 RNA-binding domain-containing protein [Candidatus Woesearchaeota archaeon]
MFYKRHGLPEEGEIVLCKVTKIYPNSVFVDMIEYNDSGMVHISEVSPGRIRNLRDYVSEGRQIVCKVLRIDTQKGHIDLSLRRVNSTQRREKLDEVKQELKAEQLLKNLAKKLNKKVDELYKEVTKEIFTQYSHLYLCFKDIVDGSFDITTLDLDKKVAQEIHGAVLEKFKPKQITIKGEIKLHTYSSEGIEKIKIILQEIEKVSSTLSLFYLGAGRYKLVIIDFDYKPAEATLKKVLVIVQKFNDKLSSAEFEREKGE